MMLWFNLISTLQGEFESLRGPSDASEEASSRPFPSEMERFSNIVDGGWQSKVDLSITTMDVSSECT